MLVPTVMNWFDEPASNVKPVGVEDLGDGKSPLGLHRCRPRRAAGRQHREGDLLRRRLPVRDLPWR